MRGAHASRATPGKRRKEVAPELPLPMTSRSPAPAPPAPSAEHVGLRSGSSGGGPAPRPPRVDCLGRRFGSTAAPPLGPRAAAPVPRATPGESRVFEKVLTDPGPRAVPPTPRDDRLELRFCAAAPRRSVLDPDPRVFEFAPRRAASLGLPMTLPRLRSAAGSKTSPVGPLESAGLECPLTLHGDEVGMG